MYPRSQKNIILKSIRLPQNMLMPPLEQTLIIEPTKSRQMLTTHSTTPVLLTYERKSRILLRQILTNWKEGEKQGGRASYSACALKSFTRAHIARLISASISSVLFASTSITRLKWVSSLPVRRVSSTSAFEKRRPDSDLTPASIVAHEGCRKKRGGQPRAN